MYPGNAPACGQLCVCIRACVVLSLWPALTWLERSQRANDRVHPSPFQLANGC